MDKNLSLDDIVTKISPVEETISTKLSFYKPFFLNDEEYNWFALDLIEKLYEKLDPYKLLSIEIMLSELASNAYRFGVQTKKDFVYLSATLGEKGVILKTKQSKRFLSKSQADSLNNKESLQRSNDYMTKSPIELSGTSFIVNHADDIFVDLENKEINVLKLY